VINDSQNNGSSGVDSNFHIFMQVSFYDSSEISAGKPECIFVFLKMDPVEML